MNTFMRFPQGKSKALTFSYDDANRDDIRLVEIFNKYGLKGTFNINTGILANSSGEEHLTVSEAKSLYASGGHEVAVHAVQHPFLEQLPPILALHEVLEDRAYIEREFGTITRGMAYPFGTYSDAVVEVLRAAGIAYSRTVSCTENFGIGADWLRLKATCHHNNPRLMELAEKFVNGSNNIPFNKGPWLFYVWGHSYEFTNNDNWNVIEDFAAYTSGKEDIWYATNIEIYDYIDAYKRLIFDYDGTRVYNPSAQDIWFLYEPVMHNPSSKMIKVPAGECVLVG
ncbi:MAG: polysaccharide deacetylase family protein [Clostridia bacterium]|nr:polysaccharide deacetylase family protein [Clostridia bacterium]